MKKFINERVKKIKPSGIRKFFDIANEVEGVISLGVGEPDFDTPWHVREEGMYSLQKGRTFYTANTGLKELREEISNYIARKNNGIYYKPEKEVLVTVGGSEAIDLALRAVLNPGDEVIYTEPCYVSYLPCIHLSDGVPVSIKVKEENNFKLTAEELEKAITNKTKVVIISFPNNPTGAIMEKEDLEKIAEVIIKYDLLVITDEIYSELSYIKKEHYSIINIPKMKERTIYINGFSKSYAMTGWRLGYCTGPEEIMKEMIKIHQFTIMAAPTTSQYAAISALKYGDKDVEKMRESYNQRRRYLLSEFKRLNIPCYEPFGAFYVFPNISMFGMTSEEFATRLVQEEKVALVPGTAFGDSGEGFVRVSYAYSIENLKEAIKRIEKFIKKYNITK